MNNSFSWARVGLLIRRYLNENSRSLWMNIGVVFGVMFMMSLLITSEGTEDLNGPIMWVALFFIGSLALGVSSSKTFSSMSSKPNRIVAMMVPASKSEKFASLMIIYNVLGPIAIVLAAMASDSISSALHFRLPYFFNFFDFCADIFPELYKLEFVGQWGLIIELVAIVVIGLGGMMLTNQALYTLGSAWWPKRSFIKTFCALYAVQMVLAIFTSLHVFRLSRFFHWLSGFEIEQISWHLLIWGLLIVWYAVIFGIFWLAWRRYKSTQLVQKFMMN